ncbi:hypothetical protein [Streptomyces sp. NPDC020742]|uniref:hypothetical protein n=1 Tax=Streptomyces sp. NPDC020742 TaxID=3154897 RepID=UPI00340E15FD
MKSLPPSPLLAPDQSSAYGASLSSPAPHTEAELATLLALLNTPRSRITTVMVGHSRDTVSRSTAAAFVEAWHGTTGRAGRTEQAGRTDRMILACVDWPEDAASWLRAARRFTAGAPDAWVVAAAPRGWAQMSRRLRHSTDWDPARTYGFASLGDSRIPALAGPETLQGMRGATADGRIWTIDRGWLTQRLPSPPTEASGAPVARWEEAARPGRSR